jgi:Ca2+-binding RTX toxin-like protein
MLMAGEVFVDSHGTLNINGSEYKDEVNCYVVGDMLTVRFRTPNAPVHPNYRSFQFPVGTVNQISFNGGANDDSFTASNSSGTARPNIPMRIDGGDGNDRLYGGLANDVIFGGAGNDTIYTFDGDDILLAGGGNDTIDGGSGNDFLCGDSGRDRLYGQNGNDYLFGGGDSGDDLRGGNGSNVVVDAACQSSPIKGDWNGDGREEPGLHVDSHGVFLLFNAERPVIQFGQSGDLPLVGDWNGDGKDEIGAYHQAASSAQSNSYILDVGAPGASGETAYSFGLRGDIPIVGDWNGDNQDDVGTFRSNAVGGPYFFLDEGARGFSGTTRGELGYQFGLAGDVPLIGDWDGNGIDDLGVYRPSSSRYYLDEGTRGWTGQTAGELGYQFGRPGDAPLVGDWNGDGRDDFGSFRRNSNGTTTFSLDVGVRGWTGQSPEELGFVFGFVGDRPLVGDWNGDGRDDFGVLSPRTGSVLQRIRA